jgi:hypothetical protein
MGAAADVGDACFGGFQIGGREKFVYLPILGMALECNVERPFLSSQPRV